MALSIQQLQTIHSAARKAGLNDAQYRIVLRTVAGVETSKDLTQRSFEQVMAAIEEHSGTRNTYWRDRARQATTGGGTAGGAVRMAHLANELYAQYVAAADPTGHVYELGGLAHRFSGRWTDDLSQLKPRELWQLIECLKAILGRQSAHATPSPPHSGAPSPLPPLIEMGPARKQESGSGGNESAQSASSVDSPVAVIADDDIPF